MAWFDQRDIVGQMPAAFRLYAAYMRLMVNRSSGMVRGGSFIHRLMSDAIRALQLDGTAAVRLGKSTVHLDLRDPRMFWVLEEIGEFTPEARLLEHLLAPGDTFLDLGANHGSFSLLAAQLVGSSGRVIAFEPQPRVAELLRRSFRDSGFSYARVVEVACSDSARHVDFFVPRRGSGSAGMFSRFSASGAHDVHRVRAERVDHLIDLSGLPGRILLKVDVEGGELAALRGAVRLIEERAPTILFELNPTSAAAAGWSPVELMAFLGRLGYQHFSEVECFPVMQSAEGLDLTRQRNLVAIPSSVPPARGAL